MKNITENHKEQKQQRGSRDMNDYKMNDFKKDDTRMEENRYQWAGST